MGYRWAAARLWSEAERFDRGDRQFLLDINNGAVPTPPTAASRLQAWECLGNANQTWTYFNDRLYSLPYFKSNGFMDVQWGNSADGTPLWNWVDQRNDAQLWHLNNVMIVGMGGLCLDVPNGDAYTGQRVNVYHCNGERNQRWDLVLNGMTYSYSIRLANTNFCVDQSSDTELTLQPCDYYDGQGFAVQNQRIYRAFGKCWDVEGANASNGTRVKPYACKDDSDNLRFNQLWYIRGAITGLAGKCVDMDVSSQVGFGTKVQLWGCNNSAQQTWDLHL